MSWIITKEYILHETNEFKWKQQSLCFDLDNTIIKPKNNRKFPSNKSEISNRLSQGGVGASGEESSENGD